MSAPSGTVMLEPSKSSPNGLVAPAQALREEPLGDGVERQAVLRPGEAVALVGEQHVGDRELLAPASPSTIWSASACFTRGSLAPWPMSSGRLMRVRRA